MSSRKKLTPQQLVNRMYKDGLLDFNMSRIDIADYIHDNDIIMVYKGDDMYNEVYMCAGDKMFSESDCPGESIPNAKIRDDKYLDPRVTSITRLKVIDICYFDCEEFPRYASRVRSERIDGRRTVDYDYNGY